MTLLQSPGVRLIESVLNKSCYREIRSLNVNVTEDRILICGRVSNYFLLSMALEAVKGCAKGLPVFFQVEVDN